MKYLKSYKFFENKTNVEDLFRPIIDYCKIKIKHVNKLPDFDNKESIHLSMNFDNLAANTQVKSEWGVDYRPIKDGKYISTELSEIMDRILSDELLNIQRCEISWLNTGEWKLTNKKEGIGPGSLSKVFSKKGRKGPIDGVIKGDYTFEMIPDFIEKKGDRIRNIKLILTVNEVKENIFESKDDDVDVMAFHQLYNSDFFIAFGYRELLIKNESDISELIEKYNQTYISEEEWIGGPVNRKFDEYFIKKYKPILGDIPNLKLNKPYKPSFYLVFKTEYGYLLCGYSLIGKKMNSLYSDTFSLEDGDKMDKDIVPIDKIEMSNYKDSYSKSVITQMNRFLNNYWNSEIDELLRELNIKINFHLGI